MSHTAHAKWVDGLHFSVELASGHWLDLDSDQGQDLGPRPKELLLAALCGCTGMDVVAVMKKMRAPFDHFELSAEGVEVEEHPRIFGEIGVTYRMNGPLSSKDAFEKAVALSWTKYCPVAETLRRAGPLTYRTVFNGEEGEIRS